MERPLDLSQATDGDLVARAIAGDLGAFDAIVAVHERAVRGYLGARIADRHAVDDLAQEVFITAYRRLRDFDATRRLTPWLVGIALNVLRNHRRKRSRDFATDEIEALLAPVEDAPSGLESVEALEALRQCLRALETTAHEFVEMRYVRGLSVQEICAQSGSKHSAVTMALHRIRLRLRGCVAAKLPEERDRP